MKLSNAAYDVLKWIVTIVLPAAGVLYAALAGIWGLPYAEAVVGTISAVTVFLGALINISSSGYNKTTANQDNSETVNTFINNAEDDGK